MILPRFALIFVSMVQWENASNKHLNGLQAKKLNSKQESSVEKLPHVPKWPF